MSRKDNHLNIDIVNHINDCIECYEQIAVHSSSGLDPVNFENCDTCGKILLYCDCYGPGMRKVKRNSISTIDIIETESFNCQRCQKLVAVPFVSGKKTLCEPCEAKEWRESQQ